MSPKSRRRAALSIERKPVDQSQLKASLKQGFSIPKVLTVWARKRHANGPSGINCLLRSGGEGANPFDNLLAHADSQSAS
jgi:hypothetical protein